MHLRLIDRLWLIPTGHQINLWLIHQLSIVAVTKLRRRRVKLPYLELVIVLCQRQFHLPQCPTLSLFVQQRIYCLVTVQYHLHIHQFFLDFLDKCFLDPEIRYHYKLLIFWICFRYHKSY